MGVATRTGKSSAKKARGFSKISRRNLKRLQMAQKTTAGEKMGDVDGSCTLIGQRGIGNAFSLDLNGKACSYLMDANGMVEFHDWYCPCGVPP